MEYLKSLLCLYTIFTACILAAPKAEIETGRSVHFKNSAMIRIKNDNFADEQVKENKNETNEEHDEKDIKNKDTNPKDKKSDPEKKHEDKKDNKSDPEEKDKSLETTKNAQAD